MLKLILRRCTQKKLPAPPKLNHLDLTPFKYGYEKSMYY